MLIRPQVDINEMQFGFMPGCGPTNVIFSLSQLQEFVLSTCKFGKAFDRVPSDVV